jgi:hypothetical protein
VGRLQARLIPSAARADDVARSAAAALGMGIPIALGAAWGHPAEGFAVSVGGLAVGGIAPGRDAREQLREIGATLLPAAAAMLAAIAVAAAGGGVREDAAIVVLAFAAALAGSFSRPAAIAAIRFTLLVLIASAIADGVADRAGLALLVLGGAAWTAAANVVAGAAARRWRPAPTAPAEPTSATFGQRLSRWRRSLATHEGWQYALRVGMGLAVAALLGAVWPSHHLHWTAIAVVLLTERKAEPWPAKTAQRAIGTVVGVIATGVFLAAPLPGWLLAIVIAALAAARTWLRERSYLAYTAVTTPLILAILDLGTPPGVDLLADRVVATLAGALLVLAGNRLFPSR